MRVDDPFDLIPVDRAEFAAEMTPALALVAPTGMDRDERRVWLTAAYRALDGIPIGLLRRGVQSAMRRADHPSKIVKLIVDEIEADWSRRRQIAKRASPVRQIAIDPVRREIDERERGEVGALMRGLVKRMDAVIAREAAGDV